MNVLSNFKKCCIAALGFFLLAYTATSQVTYSLTAQTSTYEFLGSGFNVPDETSIWDEPPVHSEIPIGFTFNYFGQDFTSLYVDQGYISFDNSQKYNIAGFYSYLASGVNFYGMPHIFYDLSGTTGNQVLKIEFDFLGFKNGTTDDYVNFQLWLFETSNIIEVHIGKNDYSSNNIFNWMGSSETGPYIGLDDVNNGKYCYLAGSPTTPTLTAAYVSLDSPPTIDQVYIFTPSTYTAPSSSLSADFTSANTTICSSTEEADFSYTGTNSATDWSWVFEGGTPNTSTEKDPTGVKYTQSGIYSVTLTASNSTESNTIIKSSYINVLQTPDVISNPTEIEVCKGQSVNLTASGADNYLWSIDNSTQSTLSITPTASSTITLTGTNTNGCSNTTKIPISVLKIPTVDFTFETSAVPNSVSFNGNGSPTLSGDNKYTWDWHFGDPASGTGDTSSLEDPFHAYTVSGTYTTCVQITHPNGCMSAELCKEVSLPGLGVDDLGAGFKSVVFPNPASHEMLSISFSKEILKGKIRIIDLQGEVISENQNVNGNRYDIDISTLPSGLYVAEVLAEDNIARARFIKK